MSRSRDAAGAAAPAPAAGPAPAPAPAPVAVPAAASHGSGAPGHAFAALASVALAAALAAALVLAGRDERHALPAREPLTGGDPANGLRLIAAHGCGSCHSIPGVRGADGLTGPPLAGLRERSYLAGVLPNTPDHLVAWIVDPPANSPRTAMPKVGVTAAEALDIAAYLYAR